MLERPHRVAILESRMTAELAQLFARAGIEVRSAPAVREAPLDPGQDTPAFIDALWSGSVGIVVFMTGVGVNALLAAAEHLGRGGELHGALAKTTNVCRGPKPIAALRRAGLPVAIVAPEPHTSAELLGALAPLPLGGATVGLLHYGERSEAFAHALAVRGARLVEVCLYEWRLPVDEKPLRDLVGELISGEVAAVAFTSQIQARHLFQVAAEAGRAAELREALATRTLVASIGPTCTAALVALGLRPAIAPEHPKMGHLVQALARHFQAPAIA